MSENIVVYGAGAIGSQVAGRMHGSGIPLTLVEPWDPQRNAVEESGILLRHEGQVGQDEHYTPPVISPEELENLPGPIDTLFLCVKSYDTIRVLEHVLPYLARNGLVVSLQNSINEEWIAPIIGSERTMGGVILINAVLLEPGVVTLTKSVSQASTASGNLPGVYVGEYQASAGENALRITTLLNSVWPAVSVDDLMHQRWSKLATNTMVNTVSAISGLGSKDLLDSPQARELLIAIGAETLRVAEAEGYPLKTLMGDYSATDILAGAAGFSGLVDQGLAARGELVSSSAMPSMLQDVLRPRKTEADFFSGLISTKGFTHGINSPVCRAATEMAHLVEDGLPANLENLTEVFRRAKLNVNP